MSSRGLVCEHAWVTLDGLHAIDVTWRDGPNCHYFGIVFPKTVLAHWVSKRGYFGLLDPVDVDLLRATAAAGGFRRHYCAPSDPRRR